MMNYIALSSVLRRKPVAFAKIRGKEKYAAINVNVSFYKVMGKVLVVADGEGLPRKTKECNNLIFGFHIHEGESCTGNEKETYSDAKGHYNPQNCPHPSHSGDMPPLFGNNGSVFSAFLTDRFKVEEIIGKTVIIHSNPDDFTTQPGGNSEEKIACGVIKKV